MRFDKVPEWVNRIAQARTPACWGYEAEPNQQHNGWYENEVGRVVKLGMGEPPADWTLTRRPARRD